MSKKFTIVFQYDVDGEKCDPPPHIVERILAASNSLHEIGFGMNVVYGYTKDATFNLMDKEMRENERNN